MRECPECGLAVDRGTARCLRCGASLEGAELVDGRYVIESELGRGSMGVVYKARDVSLGRPAAVKVISPEFARSADFVERFRREANALASIRSENIVRVFSMGPHGGSYFYAMEYIEGRDLEAIVREHRAHGTFIPVYLALTILSRVATALGAVHATGLVHRDVKPANIVIEDRTGRPVLLDFGLARQADDAAKATHAAGTPPYMAPEQIRPEREHDPLGPATDVYALGCTAMELLTGQPPFHGLSVWGFMQKHLHEPAPTLSSRRPELAPLDAVIARALMKHPSARYESAAAFAAALEAAAYRWRSVGTPLPPPLSRSPSIIPSAIPAAAEGPPLRVLIVDDDPMFCRIARMAARRATDGRAVQVVEASSGVRALTACLEEPPDLVLLDYDMPGHNGVDTLSELRAISGAAQAAVLVVSAAVGDVERWRFSVLGVKDFLAKPVAFDALVEAIRRLAAVAERDTRVPSAWEGEAGRDGTLSFEVFRALLAVGWADGRLDEIERDAVFAAAEEAALDDASMGALRDAALGRVELADIDVNRLRTAERAYVFAVARWIALVDGDLSAREVSTLRVLAFSLQMSARAQALVEALVDDVLGRVTGAGDHRGVVRALRAAVRAAFDNPGGA